MADDVDLNFLTRQNERLLTEISRVHDDLRAQIASLDRKVTGQISILSQDVRMIRATIHDMGETRVTEGEVTVLHEDMNRVQQSLADLESRVEALEQDRSPQ